MRHLSPLALALAMAVALPPAAARAQDGALPERRGREAPREEPGRALPWFGLRLGGLVAAASVGDGGQAAGGAGAYALFDARYFLADFSFDLFFGDHGRHFIAFGLGAYYPFFSGRSWSPYLGGGLKAGWTRFGGDGAFGMIPFGAVGFVSGREGYVQLRAEVAWFFTTSRETRADRPGDGGSLATGPLMTLGLAF